MVDDITDNKTAEEAVQQANLVLEERTALLQSREELLKIFAKHVPVAVAMLDRDMRYLQVSDRWCADYSLDSSQILGRSHCEVFPDLPERWKQLHRGLAGETLRAGEDRRDRESGTNWSRWEIRPWQNLDGVPGGILIFAGDITRRKHMEEALREKGVHAEDEVLWRADRASFPVEYWSYPQSRAQEVVGAVAAFVDITERKIAEAALANVSRKWIEAQEQERIRIARELHDDIGQRLALLAVQLQQLHEDTFILPEVRSRMGELNKEISEIATDIQSLSHELHSAKLQYLGIFAAMRDFCQESAERQKVEIDFKAHDLPSPLSPDISLCLFRVLQEALHNSAKHIGVRQFEVRLWGTSDEIHLTVKDSGAGFDREAAKESRGLGLISMERLKLVTGTLSIKSQPKRGTTIHARVPLSSGGDSMRAAG